MRSRIVHILEQAGEPLTADRILNEALNLRSPNSAAADRLLEKILGNDARFRKSGGLWRLVEIPETASSDLTEAAVLFVQRANDPLHPTWGRGAVYFPARGALFEFCLADSVTTRGLASLQQSRAEAGNQALIGWSSLELRLWNKLLRSRGVPEWDGEFLDLRRLAALLLGRPERALDHELLAGLLGLHTPNADDPGAMARFLAACLPPLLNRVPEQARTSIALLRNWIAAHKQDVDFRRFGFGPDLLQKLPEKPGVYIMRDRASVVLYVGKSRNLKRRVRSYFTSRAFQDPKGARILEQLYKIEALPTASEVEALLMEMELIRRFRPPINLQTEIHERPETYGKRHNLVFLVANPEGDRAQAYFLHDGVFVGQQSLPLGRPPSARFQARIKAIYFAPKSRVRPKREAWEMELVSRWLSANRRRLNFVDVDDAGSYESTMAQLNSYLQDPERLSCKVYYR